MSVPMLMSASVVCYGCQLLVAAPRELLANFGFRTLGDAVDAVSP